VNKKVELLLVGLAVLVVVGASPNNKVPLSPSLAMPKARKGNLDLEKIAKRDPRIEAIARAVIAARGINPDYQGFPYPPGPVWETYILQARDFLAAHDAAEAFEKRGEEVK